VTPLIIIEAVVISRQYLVVICGKQQENQEAVWKTTSNTLAFEWTISIFSHYNYHNYCVYESIRASI
jgi:hypothetical protein